LLTRALAIVPAVAVLFHAGENGVLQLLLWSQVVLSLQLPFAIVPLIRFTSAPRIMGTFASPPWLRCLAWGAALLILGLNAWLVAQALEPAGAGAGRAWIGLLAVLCAALLAWVAFVPLRIKSMVLAEETNRGQCVEK
jgi:manganese transport protein